MKTKIIAVALLLAASNAVFAQQLSWKCGATDKDDVTCELSFDGTFTVRGTGNMGRYNDGFIDGRAGCEEDEYGRNLCHDPSRKKPLPWENNTSAVTKVIIENGVTSVGGGAFGSKLGLRQYEDKFNFGNLKSVTIPNSVTFIDRYAFRGCTSLTSITIPNSVTSIGAGAFEDCRRLKSVTIPNSVTSIGKDAFRTCYGLTDVKISDNITAIPIELFYYCKNLKSVNIPAGVVSIGWGAFRGCESLTSVNIPEGVTSIQNGTFYWCRNLASINIPKSVTSISEHAFDACDGLKSITLLNPVPLPITDCQWKDPFKSINKTTCILYVPKGSAYSLTNCWNEFKNIKYIQ